MRRNLARVGRLLTAFMMCYSLLIVRDQLSKTNETQQGIFEGIMKERISRIKKFCRNKTERASIKTGDNLYVLPHKKLLWCPVFKAASTNWMYNLLPLAGLDQEAINNIRGDYKYRHPNLVAREVAPAYPFSDLGELLTDPGSVRFLIVRHPFERLLSAYRDKLERLGEHSSLQQDNYYIKYGRKIVSQYRAAAIQRFGLEFFSEKNNFGSPDPVEARRAELPSWWEFVQWILASADKKLLVLDEHWIPVSDYCHICLIPYNYVLHFETLEGEEKMLVERLEAEEIIKPRRENVNTNKSTDIFAKYFSQLDQSDIDQLYSLYETDFEIFNYKRELP